MPKKPPTPKRTRYEGPRYAAVPRRLWNDPRFLTLTPATKLVFVWLRTAPGSGLTGAFRLHHEDGADATGLSKVEVSKAIVTLEAEGWVITSGRHILVLDAFEWTPQATLLNPAHAKAVARAFDEMGTPDDLVAAFYARHDHGPENTPPDDDASHDTESRPGVMTPSHEARSRDTGDGIRDTDTNVSGRQRDRGESREGTSTATAPRRERNSVRAPRKAAPSRASHRATPTNPGTDSEGTPRQVGNNGHVLPTQNEKLQRYEATLDSKLFEAKMTREQLAFYYEHDCKWSYEPFDILNDGHRIWALDTIRDFDPETFAVMQEAVEYQREQEDGNGPDDKYTASTPRPAK